MSWQNYVQMFYVHNQTIRYLVIGQVVTQLKLNVQLPAIYIAILASWTELYTRLHHQLCQILAEACVTPHVQHLCDIKTMHFSNMVQNDKGYASPILFKG